MNYYRLKFFSLAAIAASSVMMLASCSNDEVEQLNSGSEISFTSKVSRATVTDLSSLKEFYVYGQAEHSSTYFIQNECARQSENSAIYKLSKNYYWPNGVHNIEFWAFGAAGLNNEQTNGKIGFNTTDKAINDVIIEAEHKNAGANQKDLVAAYTKTSRPDGGAVALNFKHAFSQIEVKAHTGANSVQKVYIKGVWFMNINSKSTMYFNETGGIKWALASNSDNRPVAYGKVFPIDNTDANKEKVRAHLLPSEENTNNAWLIHDSHSMMLLPQEVGAYNFLTKDASGSAYILFLCRIISEHRGPLHEDFTNAKEDPSNPAIHWHQLFPVNADGTFNYGEYGYVCVPVDINWEPGKKYIYNIEFCGPTSGGGQYPPELPEGETYPGSDDEDVTIIPRPDGKNPGDQVLDNPLTFKVTVEDWTDETPNVPMH